MTALISRDDARLSVSFTEEANRIKDGALAQSALIGKVTNEKENDVAIEALKSLKRVLTDAERARKDCKEPVLEFGRRIDQAAKEFRSDLDDEFNRLSRLTADFAALEQAKARAAEAAKRKDLEEAERKRQEELAKAKSLDEQDAIQEKFNLQSAAIATKPIAPIKAEGQVVREDWEIKVTNPYLLAANHPNCVKITPLVGEIKTLLAAGITVQGVQATKIVTSNVRLAPERKAIDV